jgi:hypothetical protein
LPEVFQMMAFPVIDPALEIFHGLLVLCLALSFVDLVGDTFCCV